MHLPALLSAAHVAYTIELDNEFEHQMPHRTSDHGSSAAGTGPWLVSAVMWANCMRFVDETGLTAAELGSLARTGTNLAGMERWGYLTIDDPRRRSPGQVGAGAMIRATDHGCQARGVWEPLFDEIEQRWRDRFGPDVIGTLTESLRAVVGQLDPDLPDCLPILGHGLWSKDWDPGRSAGLTGPASPGALSLYALLSRALLAIATEFEASSPVSQAISANVLRVLKAGPIPVRELPLRSGVSKEAIAMGLGVLAKGRLAVVGPDPDGGRGKVAWLTPQGHQVAASGRHRLGEIEQAWQARFGVQPVSELRQVLSRLTGDQDGARVGAGDSARVGATDGAGDSALVGATPAAGDSARVGSKDRAGDAGRPTLFDGLAPYADGWRARVRQSRTLPRFPMVLHRGGYPDGS